MIQRIQTIFLLIATVLYGLLIFMPFVTFSTLQGDIYTFNSLGIESSGEVPLQISTIPLFAFIVVITILYVLAIFMYKNRVTQMRICVFNMLLIVGMHGLYMFFLSVLKKNIQIINATYHIYAVFPIIALILTYLAFRAIRKDELLVKSYDRIR